MAKFSITVANTDYAIVSAVKDALANAQISSVDVFAAVSIVGAREVFKSKNCITSPVAVVRYLGTEETRIQADNAVGEIVSMELILAAQKPTEPERVQECLRLKNAAQNAIHTTPPGDARDLGENETLTYRIQFAEPEINTSSNQPWGVVTLPLKISYRLASKTAH